MRTARQDRMPENQRYHGLTRLQIARCIDCERALRRHTAQQYVNKHLVMRTLGMEESQAMHFIYEMCKRGILSHSHTPPNYGQAGTCYGYSFTPLWERTRKALQRENRLPTQCEVPGCPAWSLPFAYRGHYYCREHLMTCKCKGCTRTDPRRCAMHRNRVIDYQISYLLSI